MRRKPRRDPVTPEVRAAVLRRDGQCVAAKYELGHACRDQWGTPHRPDDLDKLTLDHVHEGYGMLGKRAPSDMGHLISACWAAHLGGWTTTKQHRALIRVILGLGA